MFTNGFWKDLGERALATFAEVLGALLIAGGTGLLDTDWVGVLSTAGMATLLAVLKGFAASGMSSTDTRASFGTAIPKTNVAAVERDVEGQYEAEEAAPLPEGTPVEVVPDLDAEPLNLDHEPDYPAEIDAGLEQDEEPGK